MIKPEFTFLQMQVKGLRMDTAEFAQPGLGDGSEVPDAIDMVAALSELIP